MSEGFKFFWGGPFSQWHPSPLVVNGVLYGCAEQYMMAMKARLFGDTAYESLIMKTSNPARQKRLGRKVRGFDNVTWMRCARPIVKMGSVAKYTQNEDLKSLLLTTAGTTLVEASPYDKLWGIGLAEGDERSLDRATWLGKNWLGEILTEVRELL